MKSLRQLEFNWKEKQCRRNLIKGLSVIIFFSWFFYHSAWAVLPMLLILPYLLFQFQNEEKEKRKEVLRNQFKEGILAIAASLRTGYSIENSFFEAYDELVMLFGEKSIICQEWRVVLGGIKNNKSVEQLLINLAQKTDVEEIKEFASIFSIAKRTSGNITSIIYDTAELISSRIEVEKEIKVLISARQFEQKIMNIVPFGIVMYIDTSTKGYFACLFHNVKGILIMTLCLCLYLLSNYLARKITYISI